MKLRLSTIASASKAVSRNENCVFQLFNKLADTHKAINLGAGTPSGNPPTFVSDALRRYKGFTTAGLINIGSKVGHLGRISTRWTSPLNDTLASIYSQRFDRQLFAKKNVLVTSGARQGLHITLNALLGEGDEAILFDPSYEIYRSAIVSAGAIPIGVPLTPRKKVFLCVIQPTKLDILRRSGPFRSTADDSWEIDFNHLARSLTPRTKAIIINSPHNPTGKIFSEHEMTMLRDILHSRKDIKIIDDRVYQHTHFDGYHGKDVPRISSTPQMFDRTVTIFSGGKLLKSNEIMCGWIIGPQPLIKQISSRAKPEKVQDSIEMAVNDSLQTIYRKKNNAYLKQSTDNLISKRKLLLQQLINSKYDFNMWVPSAGYFVLADIQNIELEERHYYQEGFKGRLPKDYAFCLKLCKEDGVAAIPCSSFFGKHKESKENFVRFAFCKDEMSIMEAGRRLREEHQYQASGSEQLLLSLCTAGS